MLFFPTMCNFVFRRPRLGRKCKAAWSGVKLGRAHHGVAIRDVAVRDRLCCVCSAAVDDPFRRPGRDAAARRIIGFSPDGNYFAFEQYGTLDAGASDSGWSEIDIIDTRTDEFVGGKPIHIVDESEESTLTLEQARAQARSASGADPGQICHRGAR